jgi:integrase
MKSTDPSTGPETSKESRKPRRKAFHVATFGRERVPVYKRKAPNGSRCFMVANYASGKRRYDSYPSADLAIEAAGKLARQLSEREVLAAAMTNAEASEYAAAVQKLAPFNVGLLSAADTMAGCLKIVGGLADLNAACRFYQVRHKRTVAKPVAEVVDELIALKAKRGASARYLGDLRFRLGRIADNFRKNACDVTTADIQAWLDAQKLAPQSYKNFRTVLNLLFEYAAARGFAGENPVVGVESLKVNGGDVEIFTPSQMARLLAAAAPEFLPSLAIGAFAGLRSAEIERIEWSDIDLVGRNITVGASKAKTASRRVVPIAENLAVWLAPYAGRLGKVWSGGHEDYYKAQQATAAATEVKAEPEAGIRPQQAVPWKANALRHSYASYRFALTGDAGRVAGECGNSAAVVHKHYRELVTESDAKRWFNLKPEARGNVTAMPIAARG